MKIKSEDVPVIEMMLMDQHYHIQSVADRFSVTRQRIWQICKQHGIKYHRPVSQTCLNCGNVFTSTRSRVRNGNALYCSLPCYYDHRGSITDYSPSRQGQRIAKKRIETWLGYKLPAGAVIHHEDGNCINNDFDNIFVFPSHAAHIAYHHAKRHGKAVLPYQDIQQLPEVLKAWK